jgi:hypothetical protein
VTYKTIKSRTISRLESRSQKEKEEIMSNLKKNEFFPPETLEQFMGKHNVDRPAKKIYFDKQPSKIERRNMLNQYLEDIKDRAIA